MKNPTHSRATTLYIAGKAYSVLVSVDEHQIALQLCAKAVKNKNGKARFMKGAVTVEAVAL